jgi:hypothetical protein
LLGRYSHSWEDNIKIHEVGWGNGLD